MHGIKNVASETTETGLPHVSLRLKYTRWVYLIPNLQRLHMSRLHLPLQNYLEWSRRSIDNHQIIVLVVYYCDNINYTITFDRWQRLQLYALPFSEKQQKHPKFDTSTLDRSTRKTHLGVRQYWGSTSTSHRTSR